MTVKYRTDSTAYGVKARITPVEIERESEASIWIQGRRLLKVTSSDIYWGSWGEAHAYLLLEAERHCATARLRLHDANGKLGNVKGMKQP